MKVILLDTHVVLWLAFSRERISRNARAAIHKAREGGKGLAISDMSLLEIARIATKGAIEPGISIDSLLKDVEAKFVVLPMNGSICARAVTLPATFPRDPGDRVIVATALAEGLALITADEHIRASKTVETIW